ncbi:uncharacterized protein TRIVIDRAFT_223512 [Trichoderma virens Gv29-8]|uniref:Uncharacterized protein n=1 Tax=Hypocrea virens (strain Gv29-8 / FGSC 10586) TaxID=413071 RepID=G9MXB7_HYPVG|nr:uncharacterized protein TRIVIDRAFT_223512 [Trichoderma virens Gv29-8]EHK20815.1 hypothetical protein TRIVIDRAFT_223512 [Trichoderma virens Gv29-8]UKZ56918.1 hypothetical protein TrVGV298_010764 [Trichoderma virens]
MPSILASALSLLFISSQLAVVNAGNSKFYLDQLNCGGGTFVDFDITEVHKCYGLTSGSAASFYTEKGNELDYVQTYRKNKGNNCGKGECSVKKANSCCSSKKRQITGVQMVRFMEPCSPLPRCRKMARAELEERAGAQNCTSVDEIGEPFIVLQDGTHFSLGVGKLGKFSAEELQGHLEANGKERLSGEKIAELLEIQVIKSE